MNKQEVAFLKQWFSDYCSTFYTSDINDQRNISLKEAHTYRVCDNIIRLVKGLAVGDSDTNLAEVIALFHDVGRFSQYRQYKTFKDADSVNHAALGVKVLAEEKVLDNVNEEDRKLIIRAIGLHNVFSIPEGLDEKTSLYLKLIRDADKLDIWRVFIEYYTLPEEERASAVSLGFPDIPECSTEVLDSLRKGEMVNLSKLKTLSDFKLLQLSWVYDLNFPISFRLVAERDYINRIADTLPKSDDISGALNLIREFAELRAQQKNFL